MFNDGANWVPNLEARVGVDFGQMSTCRQWPPNSSSTRLSTRPGTFDSTVDVARHARHNCRSDPLRSTQLSIWLRQIPSRLHRSTDKVEPSPRATTQHACVPSKVRIPNFQIPMYTVSLQRIQYAVSRYSVFEYAVGCIEKQFNRL